MDEFDLKHLSDGVLLRDLPTLVTRDNAATAELLAYIAEVDERRLYSKAGYSSMFAYCVGKLHLSEDSAGKRIHAARTARRFPQIFVALKGGKLHLTAVNLLAAHLTEKNLEQLVAAATHKGRTEIESWLAAHSMMPAAPASTFSITPVSARIPEPAPVEAEPDMFTAPQPSEPEAPTPLLPVGSAPTSHAETTVSTSEHALEHVDNSGPRQFRMQVTISKETHDVLRHAQALLSHVVPANDVAEVLARALQLLVAHLEKRKAGLTSRPRAGGLAKNERTIPARIRREVWKRDRGRCTFISADGHRCEARHHLQFDHVQPVARGGIATVDGVRLRCHTHNQLEADRVFGAEFMEAKRAGGRTPKLPVIPRGS